MAISLTPVSWSMNSVLVQVAPPSLDIKTPRSGFGPQRSPSAATYRMSGFDGCTTIRPMWKVSFRPICFHVLPASMDLYTPLPHDELCRLLASPVPTYTIAGFDGASVTSPMEGLPTSSKTCSHVVPPFVVLSTPP